MSGPTNFFFSIALIHCHCLAFFLLPAPLTYKISGGRPGIGMGLQQSISGSGVSTGTREVLGRLEIGEGGEVKRMRRG